MKKVALIMVLLLIGCASTDGTKPLSRSCWVYNSEGKPVRRISCNRQREEDKARASSRVEVIY